jgi:uncharacterized peroxidase-related enzyme
MAHIHVLSYDETSGVARREYDAAQRRAGRIWNIVSIQSQLPEVMRDSMKIYQSIMYGPSPLTRAQREMMAVVTSQANDCHYWITAHLHDLRDEVADPDIVDRIAADWRNAGLDPADVALCEYTEKLTRSPSSIGAEDIAALRAVGFDDQGISSATQVIAYFNYINRIADGLGVPAEDWLDDDGRPKNA